MSPPLLRARSITKRFGALQALADVDVDIHAGEVLAILGDNGAGKSTFIKILSGAYEPSAGTLLLDGAPVTFASPQDAADISPPSSRNSHCRRIYPSPRTCFLAENSSTACLACRFSSGRR
jgi:ABC-type branched-subunit amino acid transport system ATPase component